MDADFSIELGREDAVLDFPWTDPAGKLAYVNIKQHPELLSQIAEAAKFPELHEFLRMVNSPRSLVETAKCDAWATTDLGPEEEIHDASHKFASYVDIVFSATDPSASSDRLSLSAHQWICTNLVKLLRRAPETPSAVEICLRRCYYGASTAVQEGFYCTLYVTGYGSDESRARQNWAVGLKLTANAILQISATRRFR
jgi:hypothetical protein